MNNYLDSLNESQRAAVEYCDGPQLVIAGAGSGKTRVLTMKIAHLLLNGYRPDEIIALTFTKKAALEMQNRIQQLVGAQAARRLWMGTFHSLFSRILRREAGRLGFKSDFTIYDQSDSRSLVKAIIKEMGLDDKIYKPNSVQSQISNAKNNLITPGMYSQNRELREYDARSKRPQLHEIYQHYWNRCYQAGAMDFDDLLVYTNILFRDHPDVLEFYQQYFRYVLVDEYQDTNRAQHLIVEQLAGQHKHLCVVGDDAQSIYSFRGANIRNILDLQHQIPETKLFKLEQNYRSTQNIVDAANSLISKNKEQIKKTIFSQNDRGSLIRLSGTYSDLEEAFQVAGRIQALHDEQGYPYRDCAILYRTNAQSRTLEEALRKRDILYRIYGGLSFYQRKEIKDIISYLRLITNPADEEAFKRVVNYPARGIGDTTISKVAQVIAATGKTFFEVCADPIAHEVPVNKGTAAKLMGFVALIQHFQELNTQMNAYELTDRVIIESGIKADLAQDMTVEAKSRRENVEELLSAIQTFTIEAIESGRESSLTDFLADVSLSGDVEPAGHDADDDIKNSDYVTLMTIHSAKGLEFKNVFIVGVEENLLPSDMSKDEPGGIEEERRLFYVALTRAEENCFLSYAMSRFRNGKSEATRPSRFIKDIDRQYIEQTGGNAPTMNYGSNAGGMFGWRGGDEYGFDRFSSRSSPSKPSAQPSTPRGVWHHPADPIDSPQERETKPTPASKPKSSVLDFTGPVRKITHAATAHSEGQQRPSTSAKQTQSLSLSYGGKPLKVGTRIAHDRFGEGSVLKIDGATDNARITVSFDNVGEKVLLLKFAKIQIVD